MEKLLRWSDVLGRQYGERVQKVAVDTGTGCPNRHGLTHGGCIFCDERGGGSGAYLAGLSIERQVEKGIAGAIKHYRTRSIIIYFQSYSATNQPLELFQSNLKRALSAAEGFGAKVRAISVSTRPDLLPAEVLNYLEGLTAAFEVWLELGVQTIDTAGLMWLRRGHGLDAVEDAMCRVKRTHLKICAHLIAGIPGESPDQLPRSAVWLTDRGVDALKFHPLHVLKNTLLEYEFLQGRYLPLEEDEYIDKLIGALRAIPDGTILQRLTAGARPSNLRAPLWILDKERLERKITNEFTRSIRESSGS